VTSLAPQAPELIEVPLSDRKLVERFIRVPWMVNRLHHPMPRWVPPLLMDRRDYLTPKTNPFFDHAEAAFWIAHKDGQDIGRIAAVRDEDYVEFHGEETGYYGMFECVNDRTTAAALIAKADEWLAAKGCTKAIGPLELSTNYMAGALVDGFDRDPGINMPYNPPYYDELLTSCGLLKARDLYYWALDGSQPAPERIVKIAERIKKKARIKVRHMEMSQWDREVGICLDIYNEAWEQNWGFVPIGEKEFRHIAKDLKMVIKGELGLVAEVDGEPVAFVLCIQDVNPTMKKIDGRLFPTGVFRLIWDLMFQPKKNITGARLILMGIREKHRGYGIDTLLMLEALESARALGLHRGEIGWTLEDNFKVNRAIGHMGGERVATHRVYEKEVAPATA
jgi:GNAT superfamily N-acetyltransferase